MRRVTVEEDCPHPVRSCLSPWSGAGFSCCSWELSPFEEREEAKGGVAAGCRWASITGGREDKGQRQLPSGSR